MTNLFSKVGLRIQKLLQKQSISQTELADRIGISKQVVSKIVLGKKAINVEEITAIAKVLDVSVNDLLTLPAEPENTVLSSGPLLVMMGSISNPNTRDELRFLDQVMDEIIELQEIRNG